MGYKFTWHEEDKTVGIEFTAGTMSVTSFFDEHALQDFIDETNKMMEKFDGPNQD